MYEARPELGRGSLVAEVARTAGPLLAGSYRRRHAAKATERITGMGGPAVHKESAGAHLRAAWLRRDIDALHHLFAYCEIPSITLPMLGDGADDVHDVAQNAVQLMRAELEADKEVAEGVL